MVGAREGGRALTTAGGERDGRDGSQLNARASRRRRRTHMQPDYPPRNRIVRYIVLLKAHSNAPRFTNLDISRRQMRLATNVRDDLADCQVNRFGFTCILSGCS